MPTPRRVAATLVALAVLTGCNDDGRTLAPAPTPTDVAAGSTMAVTSPAFADGDDMPAEYTCDGTDLSPPLAFTGVPPGTAELALTLRDDDAGGFVHWVVAGIDPETTTLDAGVVPPGAVQAVNDFGVEAWSGPCPPIDDGYHSYVLTLFALPEPSAVQPGARGVDAAVTLGNLAGDRTATMTVYLDRD